MINNGAIKIIMPNASRLRVCGAHLRAQIGQWPITAVGRPASFTAKKCEYVCRFARFERFDQRESENSPNRTLFIFQHTHKKLKVNVSSKRRINRGDGSAYGDGSK